MSLNINILPKSPGVYIMRSNLGEVIYIGKAVNLAARVAQYFQEGNINSRGWKLPSLLPLIARIDYIVAASNRDALLLEERLIKKHKPFFNSLGKDDKSYPYIKITDEDFPRVLMVRTKKTGSGTFYGPYPHAGSIKNLLRFLWTSGYAALRPCKWTFSLARPLDKRKINACVYYHTGQCPAPCAGKITSAAYNKIAQRVDRMINGKLPAIKKDLKRAMNAASKNMDYEAATQYRNFLSGLEHMAERVIVSQYKDEKIVQAMDASVKIKRLTEVLGLPRAVQHIEAFDNSGLYGREAVGSMVCFIDGKKHHAHYRKFKIKSPLPGTGNDDYVMMRETVFRRMSALKRAGDKLPDLMLIDGGKGQLSMAFQAAKEAGVKMNFAALAEREEEIFVPGRSESIKLPIGDPALNLLMEIRDEVHRFVITYHRKLRDKKLLDAD